MLISETHSTKKSYIKIHTPYTTHNILMVLHTEEPQSLLKMAPNFTFMGTIAWNIYKQLASTQKIGLVR